MKKRRLLFFGIVSIAFVHLGIIISHLFVPDSGFSPNSILGDVFIIIAVNCIIYMLYDVPFLQAVDTSRRLEILLWTTLVTSISYLVLFLILPDTYSGNVLGNIFGGELTSEYWIVTSAIYVTLLLWAFITLQLFGLVLIKRRKKTHYLFWLFMFFLNMFMIFNSQTNQNPIALGIESSTVAAQQLSIFFGYSLIFVIVISSYRNSWVNYLNKKQKLTSLLIGSVLLVILIGIWSAPLLNIQEFLDTYSIAAGTFVFASKIFLTVYVIMALLSLLLHLPTAGIFDKKVNQLASINLLSSAVTSMMEYDKLLEIITSQTFEIVDADSVWYMKKNSDDNTFKVQTVSNVDSPLLKQIREGQFNEIALWVNEYRKPVIINELKRDSNYSIGQDVRMSGGSLIGVPLHVQAKEIWGILFAWNKLEYGFDQEDNKMIQLYANQAVIAIHNSFLIEESLEKERLQQELTVARDIQLKLLPKEIPHLCDDIRIEATSIPASEVGGDYYDFIKLDDDLWGIYIGDVSGKSISAAFYMAEIKGFIQALARLYRSPKELLIKVNETLFGNIDKKSFISLLAVVIDLKKKKITFTRAGHCPLGWYDPAKGRWQLIQPKGLGLGLDRGKIFNKVIEEKSIKYKPGQIFFLYTDGATEVFNKNGEEFGEDRLLEILAKCQRENIHSYNEEVIREINSFSQNRMSDDVTMIVIHIEDKTKQF